MTSQPESHPIRVLLVDDSELVRRGVREVLTSLSRRRILVVGEAGSVASAVEECQRSRPDVVLLDIRLPDGSGLDACRRILAQQPGVKVLVLTSFSSDKYVYDAIMAGAQGYLMKEVDPVGLVHAIEDVVDGKPILDAEITATVMKMIRSQATGSSSEDISSLSPQEKRVLALVSVGKTNKEIGEELGLSDNTVKNYLGSVFEKLQVRRRSQAAAIFLNSTRN